MNQERIEGILQSIFRRASFDEGFRALCLTSPDEMFKTHYGMSLEKPGSIKFSEVPSDNCLVLPPLAQIKLDEDDLKIVSDGSELKIARYENWGSESVKKMFKQAKYENWGGE
ncbi:TPA: hypothetical protein ACPJ1N_001576 [Vibrio diabolicus]